MGDTRNSAAMFADLYSAALRAIAANNISPVGRDGRARVDLEWITAQGALAGVLRSISSGDIPMHADECAARKSPVATCNCRLLPTIQAMVEKAVATESEPA